MNEAVEQPKKDSWPRTEHGTIDWEVVFEKPEIGLIALVEQTQTMDGIMRCSSVIIRALFSRDSDANNRRVYERQVNEVMLLGDGSLPVSQRKGEIVKLMRQIKENRVMAAELHVRRQKRKAEDAAAEAEAARRAEDEAAAAALAAASAPPDDPEAAFRVAFPSMVAARMGALHKDVNQNGGLAGRPLPFPVSTAFAEHFGTLIAEHFAPAMSKPCRSFIR
ncbi:MAG: hypothetical protein OXR84_03410 [Magnetovibrio sp.]|nr:hypothetical protein [Magnetovibrio sp.]